MHMLRLKHSLLSLIFLGGIGLSLYKIGVIDLSRLLYFYPCEEPIRYRIDTVDSRFNLTLQDVRDTSQDAASLWNMLYGKSLFVYDPGGQLSINLTFDARQQLTNEYKRLEDELKEKESILNPQIAEFRKRVDLFNERAKRLDEEIEFWNSQGGAPPGEYERLIKEQEFLKNEAVELNQLSESLNQSAQIFNVNVQDLNRTVDSLKHALTERPEEGIFNGAENRIEVYFNNNRAELTRTIAHEMGHARGLGHASDTSSIMYPKTTAVLAPSKEDAQLLLSSCQRQNKITLLQEQLFLWLKTFQTSP